MSPREITMPSNRSCRMSIVACVCHVAPSTLEPHVIGIHIIHFRLQEIAYHRSVALAVDGYGNARFVLEEIRIDDSARPKSAPNSDFLGIHLELVYLAWIGTKFDNFACSHIHSSKNGSHC